MKQIQLALQFTLLEILCLTVLGVDNFTVQFMGSCTSSIDLKVAYSGTGTVDIISWKFSKMADPAKTLNMIAALCQAGAGADPAFPVSRMNFTCDDTENIYTATISNFNESTDAGDWEAALSIGGSYTNFKSVSIECEIATTTSTTPTTTSTTPTTSSTLSTTTITTPTTSTIVKPTATISTTATSITTVDNSSDGKLAVIIVSSVVGGLLFVGIAIAALFIFHRQRNKKHTTRNQRHLGRDHHKLYKTSKSPYQQKNNYHLHNGRTHNVRSQVRENHLNRVSKERRLNRSYYTEASSKYDNYRPAYTMEHVYPLSTSGHRFMSEYIGENRNKKNPEHLSYPGYSM